MPSCLFSSHDSAGAQRSPYLLFALMVLIACTVREAQEIPADGLVVRLQADRGVETRDGRVVSWRDVSPAGMVARVPAEFEGAEV